MSLEGQVGLVTGAARGIGRAIAVRLAREGADVAVADIRRGDLDETVRAIEAEGRRGLALETDVTDKAAVEAMVAQTVQQLGPIDVLFNNAGIIKIQSFFDIAEDDWDRILAVNAKGVFLCAQAVGRQMAERGRGKIINTASIAGRVGVPDSAHYAASKAAVVSLTRSMGLALARTGVTVNAIAPGMVDTDMWGQIDEQTAQMRGMQRGEPKQRRIRRIPTGKAATPEDIAGLAAFLASSASDHINAQTINIDGGDVPS